MGSNMKVPTQTITRSLRKPIEGENSVSEWKVRDHTYTYSTNAHMPTRFQLTTIGKGHKIRFKRIKRCYNKIDY